MQGEVKQLAQSYQYLTSSGVRVWPQEVRARVHTPNHQASIFLVRG